MDLLDRLDGRRPRAAVRLDFPLAKGRRRLYSPGLGVEMALELRYESKYQLWSDLVRGNTDRLFVPTGERGRLGDLVSLAIYVGDVSLPIIAEATVIGRRGESRRFAPGVYVNIDSGELERFRRFLELQPSSEIGRSRRAVRIHHEFPVRFAEPKLDEVYVTKNLSELGLFVTCPPGLMPGQRVSLYLVLDDAPLLMQAEVVWVSKEQEVAGLHITEISGRAAEQLRIAIDEVANREEERIAPTVLVADDDPTILRLLYTALSDDGYEVFKSASGDETLALARELKPALILMDILMPGTDGSEVCKFMRSDAELADIKVIFVSALGEEVLGNVADESGANDFLAKPFRLPELLELVHHYLAPSDTAAA